MQYGHDQLRKVHVPRYCCRNRSEAGTGGCHSIVAAGPIDDRISEIVASRLTPEAVSLTAEVHAEVVERKREVLRHWECPGVGEDHFLLRGTERVEGELSLMALGHDIAMNLLGFDRLMALMAA